MTDTLAEPSLDSSPIADRLAAALPADVEYASARLVDERTEYLTVRRHHLEPIHNDIDTGVMVSVWDAGGLGYAATADLSDAGLRRAVDRARHWAHVTAGKMVTGGAAGAAIAPPSDHPTGTYRSPIEISWDTIPLADRLDLLQRWSRLLGIDDRIVDWAASLAIRRVDSLLVTVGRDGGRGRIEQRFDFAYPGLRATANEGVNTQTRTFGGNAFCGQGGAEVLDRFGFGDAATRVANEALELLSAPNCHDGVMDVVLAPDQMILQIHESIGHPLELDRILGDERNYAGTSFVTPDMFGTFRYGSELLDVTFDPTVPGQLASYGFDDDGSPASREYLIKGGILQRGLGGAISQRRSGIGGVSSSRAASWNRPPIDRMANLNIEPGDSTVEELIESVEHGVYMHTNNSWSIDDSRNKFQFNCEYGQRIEDGEIVGTVRNPGYRGVSRDFWTNLTGVADADSFTVMGTPNCGKGELNQMIGTGHASPACRFSDIEVFGGAS